MMKIKKAKQYGNYYVAILDEEISKELCASLSKCITTLIEDYTRLLKELDNPDTKALKVIIKPNGRFEIGEFPDTPDVSKEITIGYKFYVEEVIE